MPAERGPSGTGHDTATKQHRISVESQTWGNVPPYPPTPMFRAACKCGWTGRWWHYEGNVEKRCPNV